jgi:two-component system, LuxR family, sensor kinase FixL
MLAEARLSSLLDTAVDGIIIVDQDGSILAFNKACESLFGYGAADMLNRGADIILPCLADGDQRRRRFASDRAHAVTGRHRDGTLFPIELLIGEATTPDVRQFVGILRDLRPRRTIEERLSQLQADLPRLARVAAMDEVSAALAHDFNQPLTALMLYTQAIERANASEASGVPVLESSLSILSKALREVERAGQVIQRMRRFASNRQPVRRQVNLNALVEDVIELSFLCKPHGIKIARRLASGLAPVLVDPVQIQQVVLALLQRAVDAAGNQNEPDVRVETNHANGVAVVEVVDNGPGISSEAISEQLWVSLSPEGGEPGLSLALLKIIAQNHGGDLIVGPEGHERGTRLMLQLPLARRPAI